MDKLVVASQREFDSVIHMEGAIRDQLDSLDESIIELRGTEFRLDGSCALLQSGYPIRLRGLGRQKSTIMLSGFPKRFLFTEVDTEVQTWEVNLETTAVDARITAAEMTQILFIDREDFARWRNVEYDTAVVAPVIVADEASAFLSFLEEYDVEGILEEGDHLVVGRGVYTHHGIYIGRNRVIHYRNYSIQETSLEDFCQTGTFWVYSHGRRLSRKETVARAKSKLGESMYDLLTNNCEHFAWWCCTGHV